MMSKKSNKKIGNDTETEFANIMYEKGYWVHIFADKVVGQPFDTVSAMGDTVIFADIKHVKDKDYLLHSRIEENQHNAFKMLNNRDVRNVGLFTKFDDGWYWIEYRNMDFTAKRTHKKDMKKLKDTF